MGHSDHISRRDRILCELAQRYELRPSFLRKLRPRVEAILDQDLAEGDRLRLLETLAATCERVGRVETAARDARRSARRLVDDFSRLMRHLERTTQRLRRRPGMGSRSSLRSRPEAG